MSRETLSMIKPMTSPIHSNVARRDCPSCQSKKTVAAQNGEGYWYCHCLMCGCRFWAG